MDEGIKGDFDLSPEELEELAVQKKAKFRENHAQGNSNWHYKQMAENYADYMDASVARVAKSRANNPELHRETEGKRRQKHADEKTYYCEDCDLAFTSKGMLDKHVKSDKHLRKVNNTFTEFYCDPCNLGFHNQSNLTRHNKSTRHLNKVAAAEAAAAAAESSNSIL